MDLAKYEFDIGMIIGLSVMMLFVNLKQIGGMDFIYFGSVTGVLFGVFLREVVMSNKNGLDSKGD